MRRLRVYDWLLLGILAVLLGFLGWQLLSQEHDEKLLLKTLCVIAAYIAAVLRRLAAHHKRDAQAQAVLQPLVGDAFMRSGRLRRRLMQAWLAFNDGNNERALHMAGQLLPLCTAGEEYAAVYLLTGSCYRDMGRLRAAAGELRLALEHSADPGLCVRLGRLLAEMHDPAGAEDAYRAALALDPDHAAAWANLAVLCLASSRLEQAVTYAGRALVCDPQMTQSMGTIAMGYAMQHDREQALGWLHRYEAVDGSEAGALAAAVEQLLGQNNKA